MPLPSFVQTIFADQFDRPIQAAVAVSEGDINRAAKVTLNDGTTWFVKWRSDAPPDMFAAEAHGLTILAQADALRIPRPHHHTENCLIMEWLGGGKASTPPVAAALGLGLAQQHRSTATHYGLERNNFCGLTLQHNTPMVGDWVDFFGSYRLGEQVRLAQKRQRLPRERAQALERLIDNLPNFLPRKPPASLLHGDLWGSNWLVTPDNQPALIDPAIYYGHREADLAFTELFGGFPATFYQAYQSTWPLEPGYSERKVIYNLYHLLNL